MSATDSSPWIEWPEFTNSTTRASGRRRSKLLDVVITHPTVPFAMPWASQIAPGNVRNGVPKIAEAEVVTSRLGLGE